MRKKLVAAYWRTHRAAILLALFFVVVFWGLNLQKHASFHTRALDLAKFDQAIWNTLHGRFLFSSLENQSILGNHFSPLMALLSPLFLVWSDVRVLFLVQTAGLAVAGLLLYRIVYARRPALAPWFLLAFYLNPALHEVALVEFRRVTLGVPLLALALYALYARKRWVMVAGLALALLCKESISLIVAMVGVYLLLLERDWKWGAPLVVAGSLWAVVITLWVVPAFGSQGAGPALYPQLNYFGLTGGSYSQILAAVLHDPLVFFRRMFDREALRALWRVFLPMGLVMPLLAPDWLLIVVPSIAVMLMSSAPGMHRLENWYSASVLPGLFAALAIGLTRIPERWTKWSMAGILGTAVAGYALFSPAPFGGRYEPQLYQVTDHHRLSAQAVAAVPDGARVAAQDPYVPHLSHREHVYLYPWISIGEENVDYLLLDRNLHPYPLQPYQMEEQIDERVADTDYVVELEADGIYLFHQGGEALPSFDVDAVALDAMRLDRVEVATRDEAGFFRTVDQAPVEVRRGEAIRVSLYWEALDASGAECTVSVRVADRTGALVAIYDNPPARGKKPTSWWQEGWRVRDVYYLTLSSQAQLGTGSLDVLVYDSHSGEIVPFESEPPRVAPSEGATEILTVCPMRIVQ